MSTAAPPAKLNNEHDWKRHAIWCDDGYFRLQTEDIGDVPVRMFVSPALLTALEPTLYPQIVHAARFTGCKLVVITPDAHFGYGVPVGCALLTDRNAGAVAMGPVGFDIGCGMMSAKSSVSAGMATPDRMRLFNAEVLARVNMGAGGGSKALGHVDRPLFQELVRGGAEAYLAKFNSGLDHSKAERQRIPVSDSWDIPWGGAGRPERGCDQLGSLGGGNHFIELQRCVASDKLFVMVHTGSRGFGHGLATHYLDLAKQEHPDLANLDLGYFLPDSPHFAGYLNAVAAGGNFAIVNRLILFEQIAIAFERVFKQPLELVYEISHNLVQAEEHPEFGPVWAHRKGATRAFPAKHPALLGTQWQDCGHPVLIPGSNRDFSYILRPLPGAVRSGFSVNHGAGRRMARGEALRNLDQRKVNEQYRRSGILVNLDGEVPLDESAQCYKNCDEVVQTVVDAGLCAIEHKLWPICSLKGSETLGKEDKLARRQQDKQRDKDREKERGLRRK